MEINSARDRLFRIVVLLLLFFSVACVCPFPMLFSGSPPEEEMWPGWAPDGQQVVYECYLEGPIEPRYSSAFDNGPYLPHYTKEAADICVRDTDGHNRTSLVNDPEGDWFPVWSPDGSQIAYRREDGIYLITPDGKNHRRLVSPDIVRPEQNKMSWRTLGDADLTWSPTGDRLLFSACLHHSDRDVYVADIDSGTVTNLTPDSRAHDMLAVWTLDGTKIVFQSTDSSSSYCNPEYAARHRLNLMNADGSDKQVVYDPDFYYQPGTVSVSNRGQVIFVTNMTSKTKDDYFAPDSPRGSVYMMDLVGGAPAEVIALEGIEEVIGLSSWSPDGESIAYLTEMSLRVFNTRTGEEHKVSARPAVDGFVWSPDSQQIAATVTVFGDMDGEYERQVYIFDIEGETFQPMIDKP